MTESSRTAFGTTLQRLADDDPDRAAVTCSGSTLTRSELLDGILRVAQRLAELGVGQDDLVTVVLPN